MQISDLTHAGKYASHPRGFIGLQVHSIRAGAGPFEVSWRNIQLREGARRGGRLVAALQRQGPDRLDHDRQLAGRARTACSPYGRARAKKGWQRYGAYLWSERQYGDFILDLEYSYPAGRQQRRLLPRGRPRRPGQPGHRVSDPRLLREGGGDDPPRPRRHHLDRGRVEEHVPGARGVEPHDRDRARPAPDGRSQRPEHRRHPARRVAGEGPARDGATSGSRTTAGPTTCASGRSASRSCSVPEPGAIRQTAPSPVRAMSDSNQGYVSHGGEVQGAPFGPHSRPVRSRLSRPCRWRSSCRRPEPSRSWRS